MSPCKIVIFEASTSQRWSQKIILQRIYQRCTFSCYSTLSVHSRKQEKLSFKQKCNFEQVKYETVSVRTNLESTLIPSLRGTFCPTDAFSRSISTLAFTKKRKFWINLLKPTYSSMMVFLPDPKTGS